MTMMTTMIVTAGPLAPISRHCCCEKDSTGNCVNRWLTSSSRVGVSSQIAMKSRVVRDSHVADWIAGVTPSTTGNRVVVGSLVVMGNCVVTSNVVVMGNLFVMDNRGVTDGCVVTFLLKNTTKTQHST